jgi:hypothetical protein
MKPKKEAPDPVLTDEEIRLLIEAEKFYDGPHFTLTELLEEPVQSAKTLERKLNPH